MALTTFATAIPISSGKFLSLFCLAQRESSLNLIAFSKCGVAKSDDIGVYEYNSVDKREDGDDQVVYTWAVPEDKDKREDGDDHIVYTSDLYLGPA